MRYLIERKRRKYQKREREKQEKKFREIHRELKELNYAHLLHDGIKESEWLKKQRMELHNWAANYSFIYLLYRILDKVQPKNILEFGLGQTTKVTTQYIVNKNPKAYLNVCEHNREWIERYGGEIEKHEHIKINHVKLEYFEYKGKRNDRYAHEDMEKITKGEEFDLIIIDGPIGGGKNLPRSNIIDIIKREHLGKDFIIIFDDSERNGEKETIKETKAALEEKKITYMVFERSGIKQQTYLVSSSYSFASFL